MDISDLSAVTVTAVAANSESDNSSTISYDGVNLWNFFSSNVSFSEAVSGDFGPESITGEFYDSAASDSYSTSGGDAVDLNLYKSYADPGDSPFQVFTITSPPFVGLGVFDLSSISLSAIPLVGHTGIVYSGYSGNPGEPLGEYIVVPEPGSLMLGVFAGTLLLLQRRSRNAS